MQATNWQQVCGKGFRQLAQLLNHQVLHISSAKDLPTWAQKRYCNECKRWFGDKKTLRIHISAVSSFLLWLYSFFLTINSIKVWRTLSWRITLATRDDESREVLGVLNARVKVIFGYNDMVGSWKYHIGFQGIFYYNC